MIGQFVFVFDDVLSSFFYRIFIGVIDIETERFGRNGVHVSSRSQRVLPNVCPREIRLNT